MKPSRSSQSRLSEAGFGSIRVDSQTARSRRQMADRVDRRHGLAYE